MKNRYFDYNATTPVQPIVFQAMEPFLKEHFGNPSSFYAEATPCTDTPVRHHLLKQTVEALAVVMLFEMTDFVKDHIIHTFP